MKLIEVRKLFKDDKLETNSVFAKIESKLQRVFALLSEFEMKAERYPFLRFDFMAADIATIRNSLDELSPDKIVQIISKLKTEVEVSFDLMQIDADVEMNSGTSSAIAQQGFDIVVKYRAKVRDLMLQLQRLVAEYYREDNTHK